MRHAVRATIATLTLTAAGLAGSLSPASAENAPAPCDKAALTAAAANASTDERTAKKAYTTYTHTSVQQLSHQVKRSEVREARAAAEAARQAAKVARKAAGTAEAKQARTEAHQAASTARTEAREARVALHADRAQMRTLIKAERSRLKAEWDAAKAARDAARTEADGCEEAPTTPEEPMA